MVWGSEFTTKAATPHGDSKESLPSLCVAGGVTGETLVDDFFTGSSFFGLNSTRGIFLQQHMRADFGLL